MNIKGSLTSYFLSHLKRKHGNGAFEEYKEHVKRFKRDGKRTATEICRRTMFPKHTIRPISQGDFESDVTMFFIHSMIPLNAMEDVYFKAIFENIRISTLNLNYLVDHLLEG